MGCESALLCVTDLYRRAGVCRIEAGGADGEGEGGAEHDGGDDDARAAERDGVGLGHVAAVDDPHTCAAGAAASADACAGLPWATVETERLSARLRRHSGASLCMRRRADNPWAAAGRPQQLGMPSGASGGIGDSGVSIMRS